MHVAIDGVGNHVGGGWAVLRRTVEALARDERITRITVFCSPLDLIASRAPTHSKVHWVEHGREHRSPRARLAWFSIGLDSEVDRVGANVVLTMNGAGRTRTPRVCLVQQAFAVWGHLGRVRPRAFAAKLAVIRRETARAVRTANAVVVQTSWMCQELWKALEREAVVLPLGLPEPRDTSGASSARAGVIFVGSDLPYKRRDVAFGAARLASLDLTVAEELSPDDVAAALEQHEVLIVSSDVESFGLPIVEAFASGCAVVSTDRAWARAVADNAAATFEHGSPESAARRLVEVMGDGRLREDLCVRGRQRLDTLWLTEPYRQLADLLVEVAA